MSKREEFMSRLRGLSAEMKESGFSGAAAVAEAAAAVVAETRFGGEGDVPAATPSMDFVIQGESVVFRGDAAIEAEVAAALLDLGDVGAVSANGVLTMGLAHFDAFSRHLGARGVCVRHSTMHRASMPTGRAVLDAYWQGAEEPWRPAGEESDGALTKPNG